MRASFALVLVVAACSTPVTSRAASAEPLRFGVLTPLEQATWPQVRAAWQEIEALGFDGAWVNDHLLVPPAPDQPQLEAWTTLAALAAVTERLELGTLVSANTLRNPALLAKMATTVDHISGGRLVLGIGAAWSRPEHDAYGFPFGTARERAERLEESLQVVRRLWDGGGSFTGRYYSLREAPFAPPNLRRPHPPIIVGGQGKKWILPLVGRHADGWNADPSVTPEGLRERIAILEAACSEAGRPECPTRISKVLQLRGFRDEPSETPAAGWVLLGTRAQITARIQEFVDAGANEIILMLPPPYDLATLRAFSRDVRPALVAAGAPPPS